MVARTVHDFVAGETPSAAIFDADPRGWQGRQTTSADQTGITTETDLTDLSALSVTVLSGRVIRVTAHCTVDSDVTGDHAILTLYQDSDAKASCRRDLGAANRDETFNISWVGTPSAGAHTFKLTLKRASGTGTVALRASAADQAVLLVEDIGAST